MKNTELIDATLLIPTYGRTHSLFETLDSLKSQPTLPKEIVIVDQNDKNKVREINDFLSSFSASFPNLTIKHVTQTIPSSATARNTGIDSATGNLIIFSDDDVIYERNFFKLVEDAFAKSSLGLLACANTKGLGGEFRYLSGSCSA